MNLSPLYTVTQHLNARFVERDGWRIPESFATVEAEVAAARYGLALADETPNGKLSVEGLQAESVLREALGAPALAVNAGAAVGAAHIYRLRPDMFFLSTPPGAEAEALARVTSAVAGRLVTATDLTHGRSELRLIGPASSELLSRLCGLDFQPSAFPSGTAMQTSLAKTPQLILRRDIGLLPAYSLIGARSLGAYLWETILHAGREWQIAPIGGAALRALSAS